MTTAFLFPGQGAQQVGMGHDIYKQYSQARARYEKADALLDVDLTTKMFGAGGDEQEEQKALTATDVAQPALFTHSLALMAVLEEQGHQPDMTAGHSLGEYSALAAAGALTFEEGLRVVRRRGELMAEAGARKPGTMAAVLGLEDEAVQQVCQQITQDGEGVVQAANFNAPGQVVISGDPGAIERASEAAQEAGARRVVPLNVSGAFHSPLMQYARDGLAETLEAIPLREPRCPVYLNVTAEPTTDPDEIRKHLLAQLLSPVRWAPSVERMHQDGAERFLEVGAGRVLSGLVRRTLGREGEIANVDTADDLEEWVREA